MEEIPEQHISAANSEVPRFPIRYSLSKLEHSKNPNASENNHELIDCHNPTPDVPFVPSLVKSLTKKNIFSKKSIKDLFLYKKHSCKNVTTLCTPCHECEPKFKPTKESSRCHNHAWACQKMDDLFSCFDPSSECCASIPEDAVSVQSFGSQAGCGEIFVDEEYIVSLEVAANPKMSKDGSPTVKQSAVASEFEGGNEQLASSAQPEVLDIFAMWESINSTISVGQSLIQGAISSPTENFQEMTSEMPPMSNKSDFAVINRTPKGNTPLSDTSASHLVDFTNQINTAEAKTPNTSNNTVVQKSENQESTIDEGYCDYISSEDHTGQSLTPIRSKTVRRDSYSGDALYELFYDLGEVETTPIFDDEMDLTHSVCGLPSPDLPLSMYSFHVGSEENIAPTLPAELIKNDFIQSNWMGKDCLMKLCDTEISLTMGLVNWLKQRTAKDNKTEVNTSDTDLCQGDKIQSDYLTSVLGSSCQKTWKDSNLISKHYIKQQKEGSKTSESLPKTPPTHVCFQIFNLNSPLTHRQSLASPLQSSPSSGAGTMFILAINKEYLCQSCKALLKNNTNKLQLCHSCVAFVKYIKTSGCTNPYQPKTDSSQLLNVGVLPSPCSSYGIESDISLFSLVEQCANQMSLMQMNQQHDISTAVQPDKKQQQRKCTKMDVKSKKKDYLTGKGSLRYHADHSSPVIGDKKYNKKFDDLSLDSLVHPQHHKANPLINSEVSNATRPTSLTLLNPNSSELSKKKYCRNRKVKEKEHKQMKQIKKVTVNKDKVLDAAVVERKTEHHRRKK